MLFRKNLVKMWEPELSSPCLDTPELTRECEMEKGRAAEPREGTKLFLSSEEGQPWRRGKKPFQLQLGIKAGDESQHESPQYKKHLRK